MGNTYKKPLIYPINDIENNNNEHVNEIIYENYKNIDNYNKCNVNLKNIKSTNIKGIVYKNKDEYGDFNWMIKTGNYKNTLFIFDDNLYEHKTNIEGFGLSKIRKYNEFGKYGKINSAGIILGIVFNNGFTKLNDNNKSMIDGSIKDIKCIIMENNYNEIYFSSDEKGNIVSSYCNLSKDIIKYVSEQLFLLNDLLEKV
jgi:hypothetical protein